PFRVARLRRHEGGGPRSGRQPGEGVRPRGSRVNAIAPGFVETDWHATNTEEHRRSIEGKITLGRFADPDEIAAAYLMAVDNPYLNGAVIPIDGGYSYR